METVAAEAVHVDTGRLRRTEEDRPVELRAQPSTQRWVAIDLVADAGRARLDRFAHVALAVATCLALYFTRCVLVALLSVERTAVQRVHAVHVVLADLV